MDINIIITTMCALFAIVIAGFVAFKLKVINEEFSRQLSRFVINVTCPFMIIASAMGEQMPDKSKIPSVLVVSALTYATLIPLAYLLPRLLCIKSRSTNSGQTDIRGMYSFMLCYGNVIFIGLPIVASIFGPEAVFYACILNVCNTLTVFVVGMMFVSGESLKGGFNYKLLVSPPMIGVYISIIIVCAGWHTPKALAMPMTLLGNMTVPASLVVIGASLANIPTRRIIGPPMTFVVCAIKLLLLPMLLYTIVTALGFDQRIAAINMMLISMPVANFGTMFCLKLGKDDTLMSQGTFWSTVFSIFSIPLLAWLML